LSDLTVYGRQETWEDSPACWPKPWLGPNGSVSAQAAFDAGLSLEPRANESVIDEAARTDYKRRIAELEQVIDDADGAGDAEASASARKELDALIEQLASAYGLGGRPRRTPDDIERARKAVTRRIRDAMSRIDRLHPALGRHLPASVHTGGFCCYAPEREVTWTVELS
jgi:hypothetical protein